jgi:chemotaxis receptor (MCP) glutamine deamidase CheD
MQQESNYAKNAAPATVTPLPGTASLHPASDREKCKILAKKGFLVARNTTSGLVMLIYSKEFQLGVLLHLPLPGSTVVDSAAQIFAKSAIAMILAEFETLGVRRRDLLTYVIGGSATDTLPEVSKLTVQRALWSHGLSLSACDLGGSQLRSIWMDVESGRTIVRSEPMANSILVHCPAA